MPIPSKIPDDDLPKLKAQIGQWVLRSGPLAVPVDHPTPLAYWQQIALDLPHLSIIAMVVFSIAPSEACVERSFSHQKQVHSDSRARLSDDSVRIKALLC